MCRNARVLPLGESYPLQAYLRWQNAFLLNDEARKYPHVPKLIFQICKRLLESVFEPDGVKFIKTERHAVHDCTMGAIQVNWKNLYTHKGKAKQRYVINIIARFITLPYEKDLDLQKRFQLTSVYDMEKELDTLDVQQLLSLLHVYMSMPKKPLASVKNLITYMDTYSIHSEVRTPAVHLYKTWHCIVFFLCNVFSYLTVENYEIVASLIPTWMLEEITNEAKMAVHGHMRDLYARNLKQQEEQAKIYHKQRIT